MGSIGIQAAGVGIALPAASGNETGTLRRLTGPAEYLIATLLPIPVSNSNGALDIRA